MPSITLHPPALGRHSASGNPLPPLLQTPSGLAILDIQGTINSTISGENNGRADGAVPVGKLVFPLYDPSNPASDTAWQKRVHLYIGKHQRMTGEVKKLAKPLALVRRRDDANNNADALEITEIVYYKLLFAHRPEPVGGGEEAK